MVNILFAKRQHGSILVLAFSLKHQCAQAQPHRAASIAVDYSRLFKVYTLNTGLAFSL